MSLYVRRLIGRQAALRQAEVFWAGQLFHQWFHEIDGVAVNRLQAWLATIAAILHGRARSLISMSIVMDNQVEQ
jgi:hypothetical protein